MRNLTVQLFFILFLGVIIGYGIHAILHVNEVNATSHHANSMKYYKALNLEDNTMMQVTSTDSIGYNEGDSVWVNEKQIITSIDSNTMKAVIINPGKVRTKFTLDGENNIIDPND